MGPNFFLQHFKNTIILNFVKFLALKKGISTNFFSPLSFVAVFGSGIRDPGWVPTYLKMRIRDKHPGSATQLVIKEKHVPVIKKLIIPVLKTVNPDPRIRTSD